MHIGKTTRTAALTSVRITSHCGFHVKYVRALLLHIYILNANM